ncbi:MAG: hypothetical protein PHV16_03835 [Candidatus Nanoarchaeia archaeon]|nr:hypothetical protein [Candidatus Nanoarchaeia archaeon]
MGKKRCLILLFSLFIVILVPSINAAEIYGTVYDMSLNPAKGAIIEVNSTTKQAIVSKDGDYSFELPVGEYLIEAVYTSNHNVYSAEEEIIIVDKGRYVLDLLLFPDLSEENELLLLGEEIEVENPYEDEEKQENFTWLYLIIGIVLLTGIIVFLMKTKKKPKKEQKLPEEEDPKNKIYEFIKQNQGRVTQREIRKNFSMSEASISLILTELENENKIKKIKRGKGNIIILNK